MLKVFKYPIPIADTFEIDMPGGAVVLHVDTQQGQPQLWALVSPEAPLILRRFRFAGTGHPIDANSRPAYCRTFKMRSDALIFHIFEIFN